MITKLFIEKFKMGYNFRGSYYEIFENPVYNEVKSIPEAKTLGLRGCLNKATGNLYVFNGNSLFHTDIVRILGFKLYQTVAVEFNPSGDWDITNTTDFKGMESENMSAVENNIYVERVSNILRSIR